MQSNYHSHVACTSLELFHSVASLNIQCAMIPCSKKYSDMSKNILRITEVFVQAKLMLPVTLP